MKLKIDESDGIEFDDTGAGQPVVLLHAFPLSRAMWRSQVAAFSAQYRLIVPDLRGFGSSSGFSGAPSIEQMADDVAQLLASLKLDEPVVVCGLSMGGYVALAFARKYADRLRALVLADTRAEGDSAEARAGRDQLIAFTESHAASDVIDKLLPKLLSPAALASQPEVVSAVRGDGSAQSTGAIAGALRALRDCPDSTPSLAGIRVPTLVLVGSEDALTPPALSHALAAAIPGAKLETIAGAGHLSHLEQPDAFNAALRGFLRSLDPR